VGNFEQARDPERKVINRVKKNLNDRNGGVGRQKTIRPESSISNRKIEIYSRELSVPQLKERA